MSDAADGSEPVAPRREGGPVWTLVTLTDEELVALGEAPLDPVVLPYLEGLPSAQWGPAVASARRSLLVRGLPDPGDALLASALELRRTAPVVLVVHRLLGAVSPRLEPSAATRYLHAAPGVAVLEDVGPEGVHALSVVDQPEWAGVLHDYLVPEGALPGRGTVTAGAEDPAVQRLRRLGDPTVLAEAVVCAVTGPGPVLSAALGPGGCYLDSAGRGEHRGLTPASLVDTVVRQVEDALAEAAAASARGTAHPQG